MFADNWPEVPEDARPKRLYVNEPVTNEERAILASKGWEVVDTRILPGKTDQERLEAVKAVLEGIRVGSIQADKMTKDFLDLEMYVLGVKGKGAQATDRGDIDKRDLDSLLSFSATKASPGFKERMRELETETKNTKKAPTRKKTKK